MEEIVILDNNSTLNSSSNIFGGLFPINFQKLSTEYNDQVLEELAFQKLSNGTYNGTFDYIWGIIKQLLKLDLQSLGKEKIVNIGEFINQLIQTANKNNGMSTYLDTEDIMSISETNAANFFGHNNDLVESLSTYTNEIKEYLRVLGKQDDVCITLQETPEIKDFKVIIINIKTEYSDLDEKLDLYDDIGDILNEITDKIAAEKGELMYDKLAGVSYLIEGN